MGKKANTNIGPKCNRTCLFLKWTSSANKSWWSKPLNSSWPPPTWCYSTSRWTTSSWTTRLSVKSIQTPRTSVSNTTLYLILFSRSRGRRWVSTAITFSKILQTRVYLNQNELAWAQNFFSFIFLIILDFLAIQTKLGWGQNSFYDKFVFRTTTSPKEP